jgi:hypothetical protein
VRWNAWGVDGDWAMQRRCCHPVLPRAIPLISSCSGIATPLIASCTHLTQLICLSNTKST